MTVRRTENGIKYIHFHDKGCNEKKEKCKTNLLQKSALSVLPSVIYSNHVDKSFCPQRESTLMANPVVFEFSPETSVYEVLCIMSLCSTAQIWSNNSILATCVSP